MMPLEPRDFANAKPASSQARFAALRAVYSARSPFCGLPPARWRLLVCIDRLACGIGLRVVVVRAWRIHRDVGDAVVLPAGVLGELGALPRHVKSILSL